MYVETEGIVIKSMKYGEADAILTVLTKKLGKVKVFSKASKRMKSPLLSGTQVFAHSFFSLYPSRDAYSLQKVELRESYYNISSDFDKFAYSSYFLEMTDKLLTDHQPSGGYFALLKEMLDLIQSREDYDLLRVIYDLKALYFAGLKPQMSKCANCGMIELDRCRYFGVDEGGIVCNVCRFKLPYAVSMDPSSIRFMRYVYEQDVRTAADAKVSKILIKEIMRILDRYREYHLGKMKLVSLDLINHLKEV